MKLLKKMKHIILVITLLISLSAQADTPNQALYVCQGISNHEEKELCISKATQIMDDRTTTTTIHESLGVSISMIWPWIWWGLYYILGFIIGLYLFKDSRSRDWVFLGIRPIIWLTLAIFQPVIAIIAYWLLHYSRFSMSYSEAVTTIKDPLSRE